VLLGGSIVPPGLPGQADDAVPASRVEMWRGGGEPLRFHIPLIKPDVRISRIRLSDKASRVRPREVARPQLKLHQPQRLVQVFVREA
jgi:hypothetical protein